MRGGGIAFHLIRLLISWDPAEPKLACSITMPFPEANLPVREPKRKFAVHLGLILKKGKRRRVQELLERRVVAACTSVLRIGAAAPPRRQAPLQGANAHALQEDLDANWGG